MRCSVLFAGARCGLLRFVVVCCCMRLLAGVVFVLVVRCGLVFDVDCFCVSSVVR